MGLLCTCCITRDRGQAVAGISEAGERLGQRSLPGRARSEVMTGLRSVLSHPYTIFFRIADGRIEIVRALHERRDFRAIFSKPER
ncbi:MAG: type II toxin-antitoxin system RelE/ParE family toxin [Methylobacteriaceae bacterium]|nr:type II toxin-antitoxin system RelE/ParE family toxin [Methylobacteriaceae bacterium]